MDQRGFISVPRRGLDSDQPAGPVGISIYYAWIALHLFVKGENFTADGGDQVINHLRCFNRTERLTAFDRLAYLYGGNIDNIAEDFQGKLGQTDGNDFPSTRSQKRPWLS